MRVPSHPTLIRRMLDARLKQLVTTKPILAASLVHFNSRRCWEQFYYLLQLVHLILQLLEKGSLLQQLARRSGKTVLQ